MVHCVDCNLPDGQVGLYQRFGQRPNQ